jgi:hypothetical protein
LLAGLLGLEVLDLHFRPPLLMMVVVVEWFKSVVVFTVLSPFVGRWLLVV